MRSDERDKNNKRNGMMGRAKDVVHLPFAPCMLPFPLSPASQFHKEIPAERERNTLAVLIETFLTAPALYLQSYWQKVNLKTRALPTSKKSPQSPLLYVNYEPFLSFVNFLGQFNPKSDTERQGCRLYSVFPKMQLNECVHWTKTFLWVFLDEEFQLKELCHEIQPNQEIAKCPLNQRNIKITA